MLVLSGSVNTTSKQPTPRQGTKTYSRLSHMWFRLRKQPTPRQGTKTFTSIYLHNNVVKQLTPR